MVESFDDLLTEFAYRTFTHKVYIQNLVEQDLNQYEISKNIKIPEENRQEVKNARLSSMVALYRGISRKLPESVKQYLLVRNDLGMNLTQISTVVAHASVIAIPKTDINHLTKWYDGGFPKTVFMVKGDDIINAERVCTNNDIPHYAMVDKKDNITCIGIGPTVESELYKVSAACKLNS